MNHQLRELPRSEIKKEREMTNSRTEISSSAVQSLIEATNKLSISLIALEGIKEARTLYFEALNTALNDTASQYDWAETAGYKKALKNLQFISS